MGDRQRLLMRIANAAFADINVPLDGARADQLRSEIAQLLRAATPLSRHLQFDAEPADFQRVRDAPHEERPRRD